MTRHQKEAQIRALLNFDWTANLGPLIVDREDIQEYVRAHGLPTKSPKSGEISYEKVGEAWKVTYWERNINIGSKLFPDKLSTLEAILDSVLPQYVRYNPPN